ncbi:MAG TPA: Hsp33 family molecular chaperone HslO [Candidatus Merdivicinus faecavium]|nr:Hsp33 family molecular chaperone HslO [Candidatus Merdivicinus faecavium]
MARLTRAISADGSVMAMAIDSTDIAARIEEIHHTSAVVTAALGRLATAASMMGVMLKGEGDSVTVRVDADGPAGVLIAVADSQGFVKAYVENPVVELPLNARGKLDVAGAVGRNGYLRVIKDLGLKEPYSGQVPLVSGELAEDVTQYYAVSEQTPTVCGLGVLVNPDLTVRAAGGFLVQLLPFADDAAIDQLERNVKAIPPASAMIDQGMQPAEICEKLLEGLSPQILDDYLPAYRCDCSRERVERAVISLGKAQLDQLIEEDHGAELSCHFCGKRYAFSEQELRQIRDAAAR